MKIGMSSRMIKILNINNILLFGVVSSFKVVMCRLQDNYKVMIIEKSN